jgi:ADP-ribosylglycohydrolase
MGSVMGAFVGDAAGATLEFLDHKTINKETV